MFQDIWQGLKKGVFFQSLCIVNDAQILPDDDTDSMTELVVNCSEIEADSTLCSIYRITTHT